MKERATMFTVASSALAGPREHTLPACLPKTGKWWKGEEGGMERSQDMVRQSVTGELAEGARNKWRGVNIQQLRR